MARWLNLVSDQLKKVKFTVYDPIFGQEVVVFCNQEPRVFIDWQKKFNVSNVDDDFNPNFSAFSTHISGEDMPNKYVIWVNHFNWTLDDQSSLIHEVIHTIFRIWEANRIPFCPETQEFLAASTDKLYSTIAAKILLREKRAKQ